MKKAIVLMMALVMCLSLLTGCCLSHEWAEADCTTPKTCAKCEKTEGEALGHDWEDATCTAPKTCAVCDETEGEALGHDWKDATCAAPKTCSNCGETEGEALAHDWAEATCDAPKTCSNCGETEGEALAHTYAGWKATETDTMTATCSACGDTKEEPLDREYVGTQQLLGKWELTSVTLSGMWFDYAPGWTLEFREDGTFDFQRKDVQEAGEFEYVEFYVGDYMDFYVFDGNTAEATYSLNYEPEEDCLFIMGGEAYKFTRVVE